jgi:hypothetical protein
MADDTQLPPQATGNTLPGQAADAADIAPAPSAEDVVGPAAYGDAGWQNYQNLRDAGRAAPTPAPAAPAPAPAANPLGNLAGFNPNPTDVLGGALMGLATGNPTAGIQAQNARLDRVIKRQAALAEMQQRDQTIAINDATFVEKLQNEPLDVRVSMIQAYAAKQGRNLTMAEARYIASIQPDHLEHTRLLAEQGDVTALATLKALFGGNPLDMVTAKNDIAKRNAESQKAVDEAAKLHAEAPYFGKNAESESRLKGAQAGEAESRLKAFEDTPERQAGAEADARAAAGDATMMHGTKTRDDFINARVSDLKAQQAEKIEVAKIRAQMMNKPLSNAMQKKVDEANDAYDLTTDILTLLKDPTIRADRAQLSQRAGDMLKYRLGVTLPQGVDSLIALQSLLNITAATQFLHGMRNPQYITQYIMDHMPKTVDPLDRMETKVENMRRFSARAIRNAYDLATSPAGERQAQNARPEPPLPGTPGSSREMPLPKGYVNDPSEVLTKVKPGQWVTMPDGNVAQRPLTATTQ